MAETDECAQRACFLMADVTVMHSVVIRATGSTATETLVMVQAMLTPFDCKDPKLDPAFSLVVEMATFRIEVSKEAIEYRETLESVALTSLLMLYLRPGRA